MRGRESLLWQSLGRQLRHGAQRDCSQHHSPTECVPWHLRLLRLHVLADAAHAGPNSSNGPLNALTTGEVMGSQPMRIRHALASLLVTAAASLPLGGCVAGGLAAGPLMSAIRAVGPRTGGACVP